MYRTVIIDGYNEDSTLGTKCSRKSILITAVVRVFHSEIKRITITSGEEGKDKIIILQSRIIINNTAVLRNIYSSIDIAINESFRNVPRTVIRVPGPL